jgi:hypothetical protein
MGAKPIVDALSVTAKTAGATFVEDPDFQSAKEVSHA